MRNVALVGMTLALGLGCGASAPPPSQPQPAPSVPTSPTAEFAAAFSRLAPPSGDLSGSYRASIQATFRAIRSDLRTCYERELAKDPTLEGRVVVRFVLEPSGDVGEVTTPENLVAPAVGACVAEVVRARKFAPHEAGRIVVSYPLVFQTAE